MSREMIEDRVGHLEQEQARQGERLGRIERDVGKVSSGIETLLERDAKKSDALTWKGVAATLLVTASIAGTLATFTWWMIAVSPSVRTLEERVTDLDHDKRGRVPALEKTVQGWQVRVTPGR